MSSPRFTPACGLLAFVALAPGVPPAAAQGTGRSLDIDLSIRASGMGQASTAVFWGQGLNQWANPALLGYEHGLRYEWGRTQLVPGLADDVFIRSNVLKLAGGGLGVAMAGKPVDGLGSARLDYGSSEATDEQGNPIGVFRSFEDIESWGFGVSLAGAAETVARWTGLGPDRWSRMGDVSLGMNAKEIDISLGPGATGRATAHDRGLLVRVSPLEWLPVTRDLPLALDYAHGWSELSYDQPMVNFGLGSYPVSEHHRRGWAGRIALEVPASLRATWENRGAGWLLDGFDPLLSVGYAEDHDRIEPSSGRFRTVGSGFEIGLANVFAYRSGRYEDPLGQIDGDTEGWSVGLPIGRFGGVRYDWGRIPQASNSDLPDVEREAVSAWIEPIELWRLWRGDRVSL